MQASVYFIQSQEFLKIGLTNKSVVTRMRLLQVGNPNQLKLLAVLPGSKETEKSLHKKFKKYRIRGEWFRLTTEILEFLQSQTIFLDVESYNPKTQYLQRRINGFRKKNI